MERIIYRKTLDVHKSGVQFTLQGFQTADNMSRTVELSLMASGDTIDLPLEQLMAVMYVTTPNATEPSIIGCTIKDNTIVCDILPIVEEGITEVQLKLIETGVEGVNRVLATPKFAIEVSKSNMNEEGATQNTTFSALETAIAQAKGVYDSRVTRIVLSPDCIFSVHYADGTVYESDALKDVVVNGESLIAKSYARGGTGVRDGEDTDNAMYYSQVAKNVSLEVKASGEDALAILDEVKKHGVYTVFSANFETGELVYESPKYDFEINKESGELNIIGKAYTIEENMIHVVEEWLKGFDVIFPEFGSLVKSLDTRVADLDNASTQHEGHITNIRRILNEVVIWENPNLSVEFPAITIETMPDGSKMDLSELKRFNVIYRVSRSQDVYEEKSISEKGKTYYLSSDYYAYYNNFRHRAVTISDTSITIGNGQGVADEANEILIPVKIIGYMH